MNIKELDLLDLLMTGEAARICGVDRRTFMAWAEKKGILPAAVAEGRSLFERRDVERISKLIKESRQNKK